VEGAGIQKAKSNQLEAITSSCLTICGDAERPAKEFFHINQT
jgi:hypothetical protein